MAVLVEPRPALFTHPPAKIPGYAYDKHARILYCFMYVQRLFLYSVIMHEGHFMFVFTDHDQKWLGRRRPWKQGLCSKEIKGRYLKTYREIRADEHTTLILEFAKGTGVDISHTMGYREQMIPAE